LLHPLFSHVNSWAELTVQGHRQLSLSFSPVASQRIEVGGLATPMHWAYIDASGTFHLMQASALHRSPFTELAKGHLSANEPLVVTLYDAGVSVFQVTFYDWVKQASTQLSPTAGMEVPVNAILVACVGADARSPVAITFSLAATDLGRGTA